MKYDLDGKLDAVSFNTDVVIRFGDGSFAYFRNAFVSYEDGKEVVYTEHNGYFHFPMGSVSSTHEAPRIVAYMSTSTRGLPRG